MHPSKTACCWRWKAAVTRAARGPKACRRPERSAWIRVVDQLDYPEIDVRVDLHDKTVAELRRLLEEFKRYRDYYRARCDHPGDTIPEEEFVAELDAKAA
jgi:uncharacterized Ntn-hydrolase superfamily protein